MVGARQLTSYLCHFLQKWTGKYCQRLNSKRDCANRNRKKSICVFIHSGNLWEHCSSSGSLSPRTRQTENDFIQQNIRTTIDSPRKERSFGRPAWGHSVHPQPRSVQPRCSAVRLTVLWRRWRLWLSSRRLLRLACATAKPHSKAKTLPVLIFSQWNSLQGRVTFHHL